VGEISTLDEAVVKRVYARWAPFYDGLFGWLVKAGCRRTMAYVNRSPGKLLEAGVGTGLSLNQYRADMDVTAIDLSPDMLDRARARAERLGLTNVQLFPMDAARLEFKDSAFDKVVAMYVLTVVPDPSKVMAELERVCRPGGEIILVNHFSAKTGLRGMVERALAPFARALGWRPEFPIDEVLGQQYLQLTEMAPFGPFSMFALLRFERTLKPADEGASAREAGDRLGRANFATRSRSLAAGRRHLME
jgi:phosphatidylethanolamine/phosphatidyl-N-methylethanolamine N-methyltransferase